MKRSARYVAVVLIGLLAVVLLKAPLNMAVDPFDCFHGVHIDALQRAKRIPFADFRTDKSLVFYCGDFDAAIFGSSRADQGLDPAAPVWAGYHAFNLAVYGETVPDLYARFRFATRYKHLRRALVALDFYMFNANFAARMSLNAKAPPEIPRPTWRQLTLSTEATRATLHAFGRLILPPALLDSTDRNLQGWPVDGFGNSGIQDMLNNVRDYLTDPLLYGDYTYDPSQLEFLKAIVARAREDGTDLRFVLSPIHAVQLEMIHAQGLWPAFEQWKRDVLAAVQGADGRNPVRVYDFAVYSRYATEPFPPTEGSAEHMTWYYEGSHYRKALGDVVLRRVYGPTADDAGDRAGFGTRLTEGNLEAHLQTVREQREVYAASHPETLRLITHMAADLKVAGGSAQPRPDGPNKVTE